MSETTCDASEYEQVLWQYLELTSRSMPVALNTKGYFIARKATWFTAKADASAIETTLGKYVFVSRITKKGKTVRRRQLQLVQSSQKPAPLAVLIIAARLRDNKKQNSFKGVSRKEGVRAMREAVARLIGARKKSVAYIKSGWLPAIQELARHADTRTPPPVMDVYAKRVGIRKGYAIPATKGAPHCIMVNEAWAKHDKKSALYRVGNEGLAMAINDELADMQRYIEQKLEEIKAESGFGR